MLIIGIDPGISGSICFFKDGKIIYTGKVGIDITEEKAILAAELCCLNIVANLKKKYCWGLG